MRDVHNLPDDHNCIARNTVGRLNFDERVRVTRVIVYEGDAAWVNRTLNAPAAAIRGVGAADVALNNNRQIYCTHEEIERLD